MNSIPGGNATIGTVSTTGVYMAPQILPTPATVTITASSAANPARSATASITIQSDIAVHISPTSASVATGATQQFAASVTGTGNPVTTVTWSLAGTGCSGSSCGTIASAGPDAAVYTAPASPPSSPTIILIATSVADPSRSGSASVIVTVNCSPVVSVSPSAASVGLGQQQSFTANVCFSTNQNITWAASGVGCSGTNCGTVSSTGPNTTVYIAPASLPPTNPVTLVATSQADPTKSSTATISVVSNVAVQVSPTFAVVALNRRQAFSPTVANSSDQAVTWRVNGVVNGSSNVGQICVRNSNPCAVPSSPTIGNVDYLAPANIPANSFVTITAASDADPSRSASAAVNLTAHVQVIVSPAYAFVAPGGTAEFGATVLGSSNQAATWTLSCTAASCGSISSGGVFTAPLSAPSPNAISVIATSQDDPLQSGTATTAVASGATIEALAPSSVTAGAASSFTVQVTGLNFAPSNPGPGSTIFFAGAAKSTTCLSATDCSFSVGPTDVATAGSSSVQIRNPDGTLSNQVALVVAPAVTGQEVISLASSIPLAAGKDVFVVEPTTAGSARPPLNILLLGLVDQAGTTCNVSGGPLTLLRPSSGTATVNICVWGNGLDPTLSYSLSGPTPNDITVSNPRSFAGLVALTLTLSSSTAPGPRTLFVADPNQNRAAATGALEVK